MVTDREAKVWLTIDNFKYFNRNLEQIIPSNKIGLLEMIMGSYDAEVRVIDSLREIALTLAVFDGSEDRARQYYSVSSWDYIQDCMQSLIMKERPKYYFNSVDEFDFWLKIYKRRYTCRKLIKI